MEDPAVFQHRNRQFLRSQAHIRAGLSVEGKIPVAAGQCLYKRKRGGNIRIFQKMRCAYSGFLGGFRKHTAEHIVAHLADKGAAILKQQYPNLKLINVTAGAGGSYAYYGGTRVFVPAFCLGGTIETTGAGDCFCGCVLSFILEQGLEQLAEPQLTEMLRFANAAAYLVTTKKGAIRSMPEREQVMEILR